MALPERALPRRALPRRALPGLSFAAPAAPARKPWWGGYAAGTLWLAGAAPDDLPGRTTTTTSAPHCSACCSRRSAPCCCLPRWPASGASHAGCVTPAPGWRCCRLPWWRGSWRPPSWTCCHGRSSRHRKACWRSIPTTGRGSATACCIRSPCWPPATAIGAALGFATGVAIGWSRAIGYWVHPVLRFVGPLPATAWLPLAFFAFPSSWSASVFLIALATGFQRVTVLTWSGRRLGEFGVLRRLARNARRQASVSWCSRWRSRPRCPRCSSACSWASAAPSRCWSWRR